MTYHYMTHHHKIAPMSGNRKHSKNNLKIYVIILGNLFMWWMYGQYSFPLYSVNKSSDIY